MIYYHSNLYFIYMNHIQQFLQDLGLSELEGRIYHMALGIGTFAAASLSTRLHAPRSTLRYNCDLLVEKWLFTVAKKWNTKLYTAENPTKLYSFLYEEEENLKRKKEQLALTVKDLQQAYNPNAKLPQVTFYEWIDGIERMFEMLLSHPTEIFSFGAGDYFLAKEPRFIESFRKKAFKIYKEVYVLRPSKYQALHTNDPKNRHNRYFKHIEELKIDIQIIDDMITIASLEGFVPIGVAIKHAAIVEAFRQIFLELWGNSEKKN